MWTMKFLGQISYDDHKLREYVAKQISYTELSKYNYGLIITSPNLEKDFISFNIVFKTKQINHTIPRINLSYNGYIKFHLC